MFGATEVMPHLWVGSCWDANGTFVRRYNIKKVLTVTSDCYSPTVKRETKWMHINIDDDPSEDIINQFSKTNEFIDGDEGILVHCEAGVSRSPSFVIAFLMWKYGYSPEEATSIVASKRQILPNRGFREQLCRYYRRLHGMQSPAVFRTPFTPQSPETVVELHLPDKIRFRKSK